MADTVTTIEKKDRKLHASRFGLAEHKRRIFSIVPEHGTEFEEVLKPSFWSHIAVNLRISDRIEVLAEDGSYFAELIVRDAGNLFASVGVLRKIDLDPVNSGEGSDGHEVAWKGPHRKFAVIRKSDDAIVKDGFDAKPAALAWLAGNIKSLAA